MRIAAALILLFWVGDMARAGVSDKYLVVWVNKRAHLISAASAFRPFELIGWADDIRHALAVAKEHDRPVFLFTHDGRINSGRC